MPAGTWVTTIGTSRLALADAFTVPRANNAKATPPRKRSRDCPASGFASAPAPKSIRALAVTSSNTPLAPASIEGVMENDMVVRSAVQNIRGKLKGFPYPGVQAFKVRLCLHSHLDFASSLWRIAAIEMRIAVWPSRVSIGAGETGPRGVSAQPAAMARRFFYESRMVVVAPDSLRSRLRQSGFRPVTPKKRHCRMARAGPEGILPNNCPSGYISLLLLESDVFSRNLVRQSPRGTTDAFGSVFNK